MSGGENESVTIGPDWVGGIKSEKLLPQHVNDWRHSHRSPWMTGVRLLDSIDAKRPDCVYREGFNIRHTPQHKNDSGVDQIELIVSRVPYLVYRLVSCLSCNSPCANSAHRRISPFFSTTVSKRCCWWPVCFPAGIDLLQIPASSSGVVVRIPNIARLIDVEHV